MMTGEKSRGHGAFTRLCSLAATAATMLILVYLPAFCQTGGADDPVAQLDALLKKAEPISAKEWEGLDKALASETKAIDFKKVKDRIDSLIGKSEDAANAAAVKADIKEKYEAQSDRLLTLLDSLAERQARTEAEAAAKEQERLKAIADAKAKLPDLTKDVNGATAKLADFDKPEAPLRVALASAEAAVKAAKSKAEPKQAIVTKWQTDLGTAQTKVNAMETVAKPLKDKYEAAQKKATQTNADPDKKAAADAKKEYDKKLDPAIIKARDDAQKALDKAKDEVKPFEQEIQDKTKAVVQRKRPSTTPGSPSTISSPRPRRLMPKPRSWPASRPRPRWPRPPRPRPLRRRRR